MTFERPWIGKRVPNGFWNDIENQKRYFEDLSKHYGYEIPEDYYQLTAKKIREYYGSALLNKKHYAGSISAFVKAMIPDYPWLLFKFAGTPKWHWDNPDNHREFFDYMCQENNITSDNDYHDYYGINQEIIRSSGGISLLGKCFRNSPSDFVIKYGPKSAKWKRYKFRPTPKDHWVKRKNRIEYFEDLCEHYCLTTQEKIYDLSETMIHRFHGSGILTIYYHSSPKEMIKDLSVFEKWEDEKFSRGRKTQKRLYNEIKNHYSDAIWEKKFRFKWDNSSRHYIGVDIYIPSLNVAIEGQGEFHYEYVKGMYGGSTKTLKLAIARDEEKKRKVELSGNTMIHVPFCGLDPNLPQWDFTWESFVEIASLQGLIIN